MSELPRNVEHELRMFRRERAGLIAEGMSEADAEAEARRRCDRLRDLARRQRVNGKG